MKRLLPFLILLLSVNVIAQDYACFKRTGTSFYINESGYLRGFRIDSIGTEGADSVFYPFKTKRVVSNMTLPDTGTGSWMGRKINVKADGDYVFRTTWLHTITIKTLANPGDTWLFCNDYPYRFYNATVTSVDTMTIMGTLDSVKTVKLNTIYISGLADSTNVLNNFEIKLSKEHGFVSVFDLYMFPYYRGSTLYSDVYFGEFGSFSAANYTFVQTEFHVPTRQEVYDFNIGDVFVTEKFTNDAGADYHSWYYDSITAKDIVSPFETRYSVYRFSSNFTDPSSSWGSKSHYFNTSTYQIVEDTSLLFDFPDIPENKDNFNTVWHYWPHDSTHCHTSRRYRKHDVSLWHVYPHKTEYKAGFTHLLDEFNHLYSTYHKYEAHKLVFSVKNGTLCGKRVDIRTISINDLALPHIKCMIYPNPANETLHLKGILEPVDVFITDITGRVVLSTRCTTNETSIDISQLAPDTYIIRVNDARQTFIKQ